MLKGKKIVLGVTGGIAIYKSVALVSKLVQAGAEVRVVMTEAATKLVTPITFKEISGNFVACDMWSGNQEFNVEHVALATWGDVFVVAPATANSIGKFAAGIADDMLTTTFMAFNKQVIICPAMNSHMYENLALQDNLKILSKRKVLIMPTAVGHLACGTSGKGRMPEPEDIAAYVNRYFAMTSGDMRGFKVLVTAAGTREAIDPVRFVGNRSSGKMGYAIAEDALDRGAEVILVSGPSVLTPPKGAEFISVESTKEMMDAVLKYYDEVDVVIKAAAVADYKPQNVAKEKIKKQGDEGLTIVMDKNPDILKTLGERKKKQFLVGFAAETQHLLENAAEKIKKKNLDMIVANDVTLKGAGFNTDTNVVKFLFPDGKIESIEKMSKKEVGNKLLDIVVNKVKK